MSLNLRTRQFLFYGSIVLSIVAMYFTLSALKQGQISFAEYIAAASLLFSILFRAPEIFLNVARARAQVNELEIEIETQNIEAQNVFVNPVVENLVITPGKKDDYNE